MAYLSANALKIEMGLRKILSTAKDKEKEITVALITECEIMCPKQRSEKSLDMWIVMPKNIGMQNTLFEHYDKVCGIITTAAGKKSQIIIGVEPVMKNAPVIV
jgi:hypothetical protein